MERVAPGIFAFDRRNINEGNVMYASQVVDIGERSHNIFLSRPEGFQKSFLAGHPTCELEEPLCVKGSSEEHAGRQSACVPTKSVRGQRLRNQRTYGVVRSSHKLCLHAELPRPTFGGVGVNAGRSNSVRRDFAMVSPDATVAGRAWQLVGRSVLSSCTVGLSSLPATVLAF